MRIAFLGNHEVSYSSETHHCNSLEELGHDVLRLQERTAVLDGLRCDLFVWVHTHGWETPRLDRLLSYLKATGVPVIAYHLDLYMGISRWSEYENSPYLHALDHFFTVDKLMADWLNENTSVKGHYLPAGVYGAECYINPEPICHANDVIFVGSRSYHSEWPWRPQLIDWLRDTYGKRFTHVGGDGDTGTVRGDDLNRTYTNSKVAVGDSLCVGFNYPHYWSDRATECMGRNGFLLHPHIVGMDEFYRDGEHLRYFRFGDFDQLKCLIDYYLDDANVWEANRIRAAGHMYVKNNHTYRHRWESILGTVFSE